MQPELNGVVIIDKPAGLSSARVVADVKSLYGVARAGHSGTLDPFATGVLVCCLNQATRLSRFFLYGRKTYEAVLRLGIETDTQDATGRIVAQTGVPELSASRIKEVFTRFEGALMQLPPVFSALKHQGVPLYKLARRGSPVQKPPRPVTIFRLQLLAIDLPDIRFAVVCSAGTYVRTLCAEMGTTFGCGGHLAALRRTASGCFTAEEAILPEMLKAMDRSTRLAALIPMAAALREMPCFTADADLARRIAQGQPLTMVDIPSEAVARDLPDQPVGSVKVVDGKGRLNAVIEARADGGYNYCCVFN